MKRITQTLVAILLIAALSMTGITAFASNEGISPRLSHANHTNFSFSATSNGGNAIASYLGYDSFVRADLTVKVEKSFLFFFWTDVDTWSASSTETSGRFSHVFALDGSGTYRATFTLVITGSDGTTDTVTEVIESEY